MRVLVLCSDVRHIGGIQQFNRNVAAAIQQAGFDLTMVQTTGVAATSKMSFVLRAVWQCLRWRPDLIWCAHINFAPLCLLLNVVLGCRYLVVLYGIEVIRIGALQQRALRGATLLVPIMEYTRQHVIRQIPGVADRTVLLPNAVDGHRFVIRPRPASLVQRHGLEGHRVVLTVARLTQHEEKGYDRVIGALPRVVREAGPVKYILVGGGEDPRVQRALERHGMQEHVVLAGAVTTEELMDYYSLCDVYAMPSKLEGFAIVFLEALACGKPVVASRGYGCREALLDDELGLAVDPDDPDEIAGAIIRLLTAPPDHLGDPRRLRARTLECYGIEAFNARVHQAIDRAVGRAEVAT